jgi:hypothetical protein
VLEAQVAQVVLDDQVVPAELALETLGLLVEMRCM